MEIKVEDKTVSLSINGTFNADELLELLHQLGDARKKIAQDPHTPQELGAHMVSAVNPRYWTELSADGSSFLGLLFPRFGWLGFLLPRHEVVRLHELFGAQIAATAPAAAEGGPSGAGTDGSTLVH